jgi:hypothetical protein
VLLPYSMVVEVAVAAAAAVVDAEAVDAEAAARARRARHTLLSLFTESPRPNVRRYGTVPVPVTLSRRFEFCLK